MDDETRRAIEAIVGAAKAEIVKIIESSKTPEEARIVVNEAVRTMASIRDEADKLMAD
jgi:ABC-type molybdate transport system ATPase subunit